MDQSIPGDSSPTIGDIRWLGAKSVMLLCQTCTGDSLDDNSISLKYILPLPLPRRVKYIREGFAGKNA